MRRAPDDDLADFAQVSVQVQEFVEALGVQRAQRQLLGRLGPGPEVFDNKVKIA